MHPICQINSSYGGLLCSYQRCDRIGPIWHRLNCNWYWTKEMSVFRPEGLAKFQLLFTYTYFVAIWRVSIFYSFCLFFFYFFKALQFTVFNTMQAPGIRICVSGWGTTLLESVSWTLTWERFCEYSQLTLGNYLPVKSCKWLVTSFTKKLWRDLRVLTTQLKVVSDFFLYYKGSHSLEPCYFLDVLYGSDKLWH